MKALILAGGQGTRLHPLTLRTPKCLLPINGTPNIIHLIKELKNSGINEIYVSINNTQLKINDLLKTEKVNLIIESHENGKLGSIGGLEYAASKIGTDDLIVLGADNYVSGLNFKEFIKSIKPGTATIALYELPYKYMVEYFGIAEVKKGFIISFQEKPRADEAKSQLGSTLIYGLSKEWLSKKLPEYIKNNKNMDTIGSMWQYFSKKDKLQAFIFNGLWGDIGNVRSYIELNNNVMKKSKSRIDSSSVIDAGAIIKHPVIIDKGCIIRKGAVIGPCTHLMHDVIIEENAVIEGSVVFDNVHIEKEVIVSNSVIDGSAIIKERSRIDDYCIIGFKSEVGINSHFIKGSSVWPFLKANGVIDGNVISTNDNAELKESVYW